MKKELLANYYKKRNFFIIFLISVVLLILLFAFFSYKLVSDEFEHSINSKLKSAALNTAFVLGEDFFDRASRGEVYTDEDIDNTLKLTKLAQNEGVDYVYSMIEKNGKIYFTSSSATKGEIADNKVFNYMEEYPEATKQLKNIFKTFKPFYEVSSDRWGTFKSILIPMKTSEGIKYIVGADIKIDRILAKKRQFLKYILIFSLLMFIIILFFAYKIRKLLKDEMVVINNIQNRLEEEIAKKTKELRELNAHLEDRVKEEVKKNREKDKQLLARSRLAQMGEAISLIAHQWRQPLSSINLLVTQAKIMSKRNKLNENNLQNCSNKVKDSIYYLNDTIDLFRKFFKIDSKKELHDINEIVENVLNLQKIILQSKNIKLETELKSNKQVYVFMNEIMQSVMDIIKNSIDELERRNVSNPTIKIKTEENKIIICDNAGGIDKKVIDKIFEPYFSTKEEGSGLGLYMSKVIIEEHHRGKIEVKNEKEGACFIITLPTSTQ